MLKTDGATTDPRGLRFGVLLVIALWLTGCACQTSPATMASPSLPGMSVAGSPSDAYPPSTVALTAQPGAQLETAPALPEADDQLDDFFDPFARPGEEGIDEYDPWEPLNVKFFEFNRQFDRWVLKPVAQGYNFIMPNPVQVGISNFFYNLRFPPRFLNNIAQGKMKGAGIEVGRFLVNSTVGIGGFLDVAQHLDLSTPEEDTGQTLGFYGVRPGPYLVLPLLPPFTVRDLVGYVGDIFLNPINWLVAPLIEVDGAPSLIPHRNRNTTAAVQTGGRVFEIVNERSLNLETFQGVEEATLDLYTAVRNAYLQKRAKAIRE
jgi:phospholipid-binding lipoprotein MlaA